MAEETLFSWIHLSDIHVGHGDRDKPHGWNQKLVMQALRKDIAAMPGPERIDTILVTGDIAFSGDGLADDEYARAKAWLLEVAAAARVAPRSIFLVPGNHDVNRGVDRDRSVVRLMESLRSSEEAVDTALADPADRATLARRMAGYLAFAESFAPWAGEARVAAEQRLFWMRQLDGSGGLRVRLVGLNTALLAKDIDERKLQLGSEQLATALTPAVADEGEVVVVMSHHPLSTDWLADAKDAHAWIRNNAHVHLSGHVHEAESGELRSGSGTQFVHVVAGAVHGERMPKGVPASHGYTYGEIVRDGRGGLELRVWPRRWSEPNKDFRIDGDSVPTGNHGYAIHPLKARLAVPPDPPARPGPGPVHPERLTPAAPTALPAPRLPAPSLPATGPIRVFLSYAPEDEPMRRELEKALVMMKRTGLIELTASRSAGETAVGGDPHLARAHLVLLLLSRDYLANDYCFDVEMKAARARREAGEAVVMAVLLREVELTSTADYKRLRSGEREEQWFETLRRLPYAGGRDQNGRPIQLVPEGRPVTTWPRQDDAWKEIALELREQIEALRKPAA